LAENQISDITALSELTGLTALDLSGNQISDISALNSMKDLEILDIRNNPIGMTQIRALQAELPWTVILYTPTLGQILQAGKISIFDALEILKYIVGIDNVIEKSEDALNASLITQRSRAKGKPAIFDALEILKHIVGITDLKA
jgi:Leucine-rich repeat (LRR) protein